MKTTFLCVISVVLSQATPTLTQHAKKLKASFKCDNFGVEFTVTKSQLYQGKNVPHSDKFTVGSQSNCPFHLTKRVVTNNGKTWTEKQRTLKLDFFNKNQVEECGATIFQDEYGIIYETFIRGRTSQQQPAPYTPQTIILSCFYPMTDTPYDQLPPDRQAYSRGIFTIGSNSIQLKATGKLKSEFQLYDVQANDTQLFFPQTETSRIVNVGTPTFIGLIPKPIWLNGNNVNPITSNSARWDYFIRDCFWSGVKLDGTERQFQLVKRNCKNTSYQVQFLTKMARKKDGHMMMFETFAYDDSVEHFLSCDVDLCLRTRFGGHTWPDCYQSCSDPQFISDSAEENEFDLPTTTVLPITTDFVAPASTVTFQAKTNRIDYTTFATSKTIEEPKDDFAQALELCKSTVDFTAADITLWELCKYIRNIFPESFR